MSNKNWLAALAIILFSAGGCSDDKKTNPVPAEDAEIGDGSSIAGQDVELFDADGEGQTGKDTSTVGGCPPNSLGGLIAVDDDFSTLSTAVELVGKG